MALKSYDSLLKQVQELISNSVPGGVTIQANNVISDLSRMEASDYGFIIKGISEDLGEIIESRIISGLYTTATVPPSNQVLVTAGKGTAGGKMYELLEDTTLTVNFDDRTSIYYIVIYGEQVFITTHVATDQCKIAKIIIPEPGTTSQIVDDKPSDGYDAWIVSARDIVFDEDQEFDDDSVEKLRSVIGEILADNIIGDIKLSENLKIINTQGTVELDSNSLQIKDFNQNVLAKFNKDGTYFYDPHGVSLAKFTSTEAFIGNILITKNSIQTRNFSAGSTGFQIKDDGDVEFNDGTFRGTLAANIGNIGGWTLDANSMYATTTGTIKTGINVGAGYDGVILDVDGLRVYDDILGEVVNLPSDGSAPSFSSGIIRNTIFEINTNSIIRTSEYVGSTDAGILINNTGIYGCEANQTLADANFKVLTTGDTYFKGELQATSGQIGNVTITNTDLTGGLLIGATIRGGKIETSSGIPKVTIDETGIYFQVASGAGMWGNFTWGDGTIYGTGNTAHLFKEDLPILAVLSERNVADIRLYDRSVDPTSGTHEVGDLICVPGKLKICTTGGSPGTFTIVGTQIA